MSEEDQVLRTGTKGKSDEDSPNQGKPEELCENCQKNDPIRNRVECFNCKKSFHRECYKFTPQEWHIAESSKQKDQERFRYAASSSSRGRPLKDDEDLVRWICRECFVRQIPEEMKPKSHEITIAFNNVRYIFKKMVQVKRFLDLTKSHIFATNEPRIPWECLHSDIKIEGYNHHRFDSKHGILVYFKDSLKYSVVTSTEITNEDHPFQAIAFKVTYGPCRSFFLCVAYRPPKSESRIRVILNDIIECCKDNETHEIFIVGDFNLQDDSMFYKKTEENYLQLIEEPTFEERILDRIYHNCEYIEQISSSGVIPHLLIGDHRIIYVKRKIQTSYELQTDRIYYSKSRFLNIESNPIPSIILWSKTWFFNFFAASSFPDIIHNNGSFFIVYSASEQQDIKIRRIFELYNNFLKTDSKAEETGWLGLSTFEKEMTDWNIRWKITLGEDEIISIYKDGELFAYFFPGGKKIDFNFDFKHLHAHILQPVTTLNSLAKVSQSKSIIVGYWNMRAVSIVPIDTLLTDFLTSLANRSDSS